MSASPPDELASLLIEPPKLGEILEACPFDFMRNFNARLSEELFFQRLFVDSPSARVMVTKLRQILTSPIANFPVVFLHGFGGSGKTTFLRHFCRQNPDLRAHFVDFHNPLAALDPERPIASVLRQEIRDSNATARDQTLKLLSGNVSRLSRFFSPIFLRCLSSYQGANAPGDEESVLGAASFSDALLVYLLVLADHSRDHRLQVLCLDNLDRVEMEYISDAFGHDFAGALEAATLLFQLPDLLPEPRDFAGQFRFVFALRDANFAAIDVHTVSSLGAKLRAVPFSVRLEPETYRKIVTARLDFATALQPMDPDPEVLRAKSDLEDLLELFLPGGDPEPYFERVVMPLFNYDFKKVCSFFLRVTGQYALLSPARLKRLRGPRAREATLLRYGLRGSLLHHFVSALMDDDYLREYAFYQYPFLEDDGYCLHSRMVLTALLNSSRADGIASRGGTTSEVDAPSLLTILEKHCGVYPLREVLHTVADAFLFHQKKWVHLVTILNKQVRERASFDEELSWLQARGLADAVKPIAGAFGAQFSSKERAVLERTKVRLNPAGFTYLKYVVTHFEYYSALAGWQSPLFLSGLDRTEDGGSYRFEPTITSVLELVRKHTALMQRFYEVRFRAGRGVVPEMYRRGDFCFRHEGDGRPKEEGYFHSTRVVTFHVDYIDRFRRLAMLELEAETDKIDVNRRLVSYLKDYVGLLRSSVDERAAVFADGFGARLATIEKAGYRDYDTVVQLEPRPARTSR